MTAGGGNETLKLALKNNPGHVGMFHSDRGFQYTRPVFRKGWNILASASSCPEWTLHRQRPHLESIGDLKRHAQNTVPNMKNGRQVRKSVKEPLKLLYE